jgi:HK97 family phage portal protein
MPWRWPWNRTHDRALWQVGDAVVPATAAGESVTADRAMHLSTVFGCVGLLADSVSTLPVDVFRDGSRDPIPTPPLLQRPSADFPELSDWLWAVMASLLLRGNAWGVITDRAGPGLLPAQVDLVDPDAVSVSNDGRWVVPIGGQEQDRADLFHCRAYPWPGKLEGLSPIAYARESIGLGIAAEKYGARFFGDSGIPSGYLYSEREIRGQESIDKLKAEWNNAHKGRRGTAVLAGVKYQNLSIAPEEAQFLGTIKANAAAICRIFRVPAGMMAGVELAGREDYSSPEQRATDFLTFTLRPWLHRVERAVSRLLPSTQVAKFNAGGMVRATLLDRYQAHKLAIEGGWLTRNEIRALEDRPPLPEGGEVAGSWNDPSPPPSSCGPTETDAPWSGRCFLGGRGPGPRPRPAGGRNLRARGAGR